MIKIKGIETINFVYDDYLKDVIDTRNNLAHAKSIMEAGVEYLIIEKKGEVNAQRLEQKDFIEIRKNLLKYDKILKVLKEKIKIL